MRVLVVTVVLLSTLATIATAGPRPKRVATATTAASPKKLADRSIGAPWSGRLQAPARLGGGERYHLRRPWRTYGTRSTVRFVRQAIRDTFDSHPKAHVLAIGDLSAEAGGWITEHHSHQSGRDVDLGLFYKKVPRGYPAAFVRATADTLDMHATWTMLHALAATADDDGGVQMIFFDQRLTNALRRWATKRGFSEKRIDRVFRLIKHEPNHDNHLHVRFRCRSSDRACR